MGWQWHALDHMQITCTSLRADTIPVLYYSIFFTGRMFSIMARKFVETQFPLFCANQKGQSTEDRWVLICLSRLINIRFTLQGWGHRSTKLFHNLQQSLNLNQQLIVKTACVYMCVHMHTRICTHLACTTVTYNTARNSSDYLTS